MEDRFVLILTVDDRDQLQRRMQTDSQIVARAVPFDEAARRANIDHPHTGLQIGTDCVEAVLNRIAENQGV